MRVGARMTFAHVFTHGGDLCPRIRERAGRDPEASYPELVARYEAPRLKPPFNLEARGRAGFSAEELRALSAGGKD